MPKNTPLISILIVGLGSTLIVASVVLFLQNRVPASDLSVVPAKVNYSAPELELMDLTGNTVSLVDFRGQVVLVNLWATWCPPCIEEMPALESFYQKYKDSGFVVVAINDGEPQADVVKFVEDYRLSFPVWLDPRYIATEQAFKSLNLPSSYVIDRDGTVVLSWVGGINRKTLEKHVTPMIEASE